MTPRLLALSLAPLLAAGTARAQAPGEMAPVAPPPGAAPAPAPAPAAPSVMAHRFGIGVGIGGTTIAPEGAAAFDATDFRTASLSLRYRASLRVELELELSGGRQMLDDGSDGDLASGTVTAALRYRFLPEQPWNWYLVAGVGGTVIAYHESTAEERDGATRPLALFGAGLERRFGRFALGAELRAVAIGQREDNDQIYVYDVNDGGGAPPAGFVPVSDTVYADSLTGGSLTIGASYYF